MSYDNGIEANFNAIDTSMEALVIDDAAADTSLAELVIGEEKKNETPPAAAAESKEPEPGPGPAPGPWFDNSPYDIKSPVREVGTMLHAFEDILWNHSSDLNGVEALALMGVVHRMRVALTELESTILQPRFARQQWMPSLGLATGMKECFKSLRGLRNRMQALPGTAASAAIVDKAGIAFAELMTQQAQQQASAVGIDIQAETPPTAKPPTATPVSARRQRHRRKRVNKKQK
jgi:hypothetical protein